MKHAFVVIHWILGIFLIGAGLLNLLTGYLALPNQDVSVAWLSHVYTVLFIALGAWLLFVATHPKRQKKMERIEH